LCAGVACSKEKARKTFLWICAEEKEFNGTKQIVVSGYKKEREGISMKEK